MWWMLRTQFRLLVFYRTLFCPVWRRQHHILGIIITSGVQTLNIRISIAHFLSLIEILVKINFWKSIYCIWILFRIMINRWLLLYRAVWPYLFITIEVEHLLRFISFISLYCLSLWLVINILECFHAYLLDALICSISFLGTLWIRSQFELIVNICSLGRTRSNRASSCLLITKVMVEFSMRL